MTTQVNMTLESKVRVKYIEDLTFMSANVLFNLLNELWKSDKMRGLSSI